MSNSIYLKSCAARLLAITAMLILSSCGGGRSNDLPDDLDTAPGGGPVAGSSTATWVSIGVSVAIFAYNQYQIANAADPFRKTTEYLEALNGKIDAVQNAIHDLSTQSDLLQSTLDRNFQIEIKKLDDLSIDINQAEAKKARQDVWDFYDRVYSGYSWRQKPVGNDQSLLGLLKSKKGDDEAIRQIKRTFIQQLISSKIVGKFSTIAAGLHDDSDTDPHSGLLRTLVNSCIDQYNTKYPRWDTYPSDGQPLYGCYLGVENILSSYLIWEQRAKVMILEALKYADEIGYTDPIAPNFESAANQRIQGQLDEFQYQTERLVLATTKIAYPGSWKLTPGYQEVFARHDFFRALTMEEQPAVRGRTIEAAWSYSEDLKLAGTTITMPLKSLEATGADRTVIPYEPNPFQGNGTDDNPHAAIAIDDWLRTSTINDQKKTITSLSLKRATRWKIRHYVGNSSTEALATGAYSILGKSGVADVNLASTNVQLTCKDHYGGTACDAEKFVPYGNFVVVGRNGGAQAMSQYWASDERYTRGVYNNAYVSEDAFHAGTSTLTSGGSTNSVFCDLKWGISGAKFACNEGISISFGYAGDADNLNSVSERIALNVGLVQHIPVGGPNYSFFIQSAVPPTHTGYWPTLNWNSDAINKQKIAYTLTNGAQYEIVSWIDWGERNASYGQMPMNVEVKYAFAQFVPAE